MYFIFRRIDKYEVEANGNMRRDEFKTTGISVCIYVWYEFVTQI